MMLKEAIIDYKVRGSFKKEFAFAEPVNLAEADDYQVASFVLGRSTVRILFTGDGTVKGFTRNNLDAAAILPVITLLEKLFKAAFFSDILEINTPDGLFYGLTIETTGNIYHVKANASGKIMQLIKLNKTK